MNAVSHWTMPRFAALALVIVLALPGAFRSAGPGAEPGDEPALEVSLAAAMPSGATRIGDPWSGVLMHDVTIQGRVVPAGSRVHGTVVAVARARHAPPEAFVLDVRGVDVNGIEQAIRSETGAWIVVPAGVTNARSTVRFTIDDQLSMK